MESLERGRAERAPQGRNAEEQVKLDALKKLASGGAPTGPPKPPKPPIAEAAGPAPEEPIPSGGEKSYARQPGEIQFTKGHVGGLRGRRYVHDLARKNPPPGYKVHEYDNPSEIKKHIESFGEAIFKIKTIKNATPENPSGTFRAGRFTTKAPEGFSGFKNPGSKVGENKRHNLLRAFEVNEDGDYMRDPKGPDGYAYRSIHTDEPLTIDGPNDSRVYVGSEKYIRSLETSGAKPLMVGTGGTPEPAPGGFRPQRLPEQKRPLLPSKLIEGAGGVPELTTRQKIAPEWEDQPLRGGRRLLDIIGKAAGAPYRLEQRGMGKLEEISGLARKLEGVEGGAGLGRAFRVGGPLAVPGYRTIGLSARGGALVGAGARKLAWFKAPGPERRGYKPPIKARDSMPAIRAVLLSKKRKEKE